jgi:Tfp pilus assembly protein PilN
VSLLKGRAFYPLFMSEFVRTVPAGVRVTSLGASGPTGGPLKLSISAVGETSDDVANWMRTLQNNGHFTDVKLGPLSGANGRQYGFTISTVYTLKL